jgi:hypothetical protein
MNRKSLQIYEKERGIVPGRSNGIQDRVYGAYLSSLDPRANDAVQLALAASNDVRFKEFLERINMPRYRRVSLQTIAKACNITLAEFNGWWQKESAQRAIAIAQTQSVMITHDMAEDARSVNVVCSRCDGLGFVAAPEGLPEDVSGYKMIQAARGDEPAKYIRDCPNCDAQRKIRKPGDSHARDKILEMGGLVKKGAAVQITQNFGGATHASAISELDSAMSIDVESSDV